MTFPAMRATLPGMIHPSIWTWSAAVVLLAAMNLPADEGMWLLDRPPRELLEQRYGFKPTPAWLEHLQKSSVQIGASGSFVSADGLLVTNHHVAAGQLAKLSTPERNLLAEGFHARTREEELQCPDLEVRILWSTQDVTEQVDAAAGPEMSAAEAYLARRKEMTRIEQASNDATGLDSQVITLYHGARYHLYRYKRYTDVRLVMAPEKSIAFFGGDTDNFEYPRYALDVCFMRVHEDGRPVHPEHFLTWSRNGISQGDLAFVFGHPGRTRRLYTVEHVRYIRDEELPLSLRLAWRREVQLQTFCNRGAEYARIGESHLFGVQNRRKAMTGALEGLLDPAFLQRKIEQQAHLQAAGAPARQDEPDASSADPWQQVAAAQDVRRTFDLRYHVLGRAFGSQLFWIARQVVRLADELPKPSPDRLREYRDSELESLYLHLYTPAPIYDALEIETMASSLSQAAEVLGADDPTVVLALQGLSPQERARRLVLDSKLKDMETRRRYVREGASAIDSSSDPMILLARAMDAESRALRQRYEDEVESVERAAYARIGLARFAAYGESVYPDATGTLRMAFGQVKGYPEHGEAVPAFTTFAGLFERQEQRRGHEHFLLPERWAAARERLDLSTPLNFVATTDIIGGNSGSPVVDRKGEIVGLIFDGNIQSLTWDMAYDDAQARAVAVDVRGILEALRVVYGADELVRELVGE